jgi:hypothetical protein
MAKPEWVAPDPAIRRAMEDRLDRWIDPARPAGGFYQREGRTALRHPAVTHDMEETQEFGRRHDARVMHPFWDIDLIEMLHRVPPALLMADGRSKSLSVASFEPAAAGAWTGTAGKDQRRTRISRCDGARSTASLHDLGDRGRWPLGVVRWADIQSQRQEMT